MTASTRDGTEAPVLAELAVLRAVFESSCDLVLAADVNGRVLFENATARAHSAATGPVMLERFPAAHRARFEEAVVAVLQKHECRRIEWGITAAAGPISWYTCTLTPLLVDGRVAGYLSVSSDVTSLKSSEQRLRRSEQLMVDTQGVAHLGTWEWDVSQPTATWSAELYRIYGLTPETYTPSYERYLEMVHPDDRARVMEATNRVFHEHVPYSHDERIYRPDGSLRHLHTWAHPVLDEQGKLVRLVGVCQDITDQKLAEEQVKSLNRDLERRVVERTRVIERSLHDLEAFNAMASHDLRAPLSVIDGTCALIARQFPDLPPALTSNLERIRRSATHMTALVNDLLALAQVGHTKLGRTEVDLSALAREIIEQLQRAEPARQATFTVAPDLTCVGDPSLMRVVLDNLLGNAWKYSARAPLAQIELGLTLVDGERAFFVKDNGAGFDMKEAHLLFAPFKRLHSPKEFPGTGMGLAGTARIIERHGGRIWAEGTPGAGAVFFFKLPEARSETTLPVARAVHALHGGEDDSLKTATLGG